jgi:PEP-CTERM motif-containing protein
MKSLSLAAGVAFAVLTTIGTAQSATITETYIFSLGNFVDVVGQQTAPVTSVTGSFTFTFNPTIGSGDTNVGLTVNSFTGPTVDSPFVVAYDATNLTFGGAAFGSGIIHFGVNTGVNDFTLQLQFAGGDYAHPLLSLCAEPGFTCGNFTGSTIVYGSGYSVAHNGSAFLATTGEITATPLPATLPLLASGLGFLGWAARRRKQKQVA